MVAARRDFENLGQESRHLLRPEFYGTWQIDRVSGLYEEQGVLSLTIDENRFVVDTKSQHAAATIVVNFSGEVAEGHDDSGQYCVQALLEDNMLVWELERPCGAGGERVRRVMRSSDHGAQLIAECVDLSRDDTPRGLRTEYWTRVSRPAS